MAGVGVAPGHKSWPKWKVLLEASAVNVQLAQRRMKKVSKDQGNNSKNWGNVRWKKHQRKTNKRDNWPEATDGLGSWVLADLWGIES